MRSCMLQEPPYRYQACSESTSNAEHPAKISLANCAAIASEDTTHHLMLASRVATTFSGFIIAWANTCVLVSIVVGVPRGGINATYANSCATRKRQHGTDVSDQPHQHRDSTSQQLNPTCWPHILHFEFDLLHVLQRLFEPLELHQQGRDSAVSLLRTPTAVAEGVATKCMSMTHKH